MMARTPPRPRSRRVPTIPKVRRIDVTRDEFNRVIERLNERGTLFNEHGEALVGLRRDLDVQFKRIAQLQAEFDNIKRTLSKLRVG
jgi:hypothetical protein